MVAAAITGGEKMKTSVKMREPVAQAVEDGSRSLDEYERKKAGTFLPVCQVPRAEIVKAIPKATAKVWHGHPVWFDGENHIVGFDVAAKDVNLLFWNGQAFEEPDSKPLGQFRAAQARYFATDEIDVKTLCRWLKKAKEDVFDTKGFLKKLREERKRAAGK